MSWHIPTGHIYPVVMVYSVFYSLQMGLIYPQIIRAGCDLVICISMHKLENVPQPAVLTFKFIEDKFCFLLWIVELWSKFCRICKMLIIFPSKRDHTQCMLLFI